MIRETAKQCGWSALGDVSAEELERFVARKRAAREDGAMTRLIAAGVYPSISVGIVRADELVHWVKVRNAVTYLWAVRGVQGRRFSSATWLRLLRFAMQLTLAAENAGYYSSRPMPGRNRPTAAA